jgi:hypothetical protein
VVGALKAQSNGADVSIGGRRLKACGSNGADVYWWGAKEYAGVTAAVGASVGSLNPMLTVATAGVASRSILAVMTVPSEPAH